MSDIAVATEKANLYDEAAAAGKVPTYEKVQEDRAKEAEALMAAEAKAEAAAAAPAPPPPPKSGSQSPPR